MALFESVLTIYDRDGNALDEMNGIQAVRSWQLPANGNMGIGVAVFDVPLSDRKLTRANFQLGNRIVLDHSRAGLWAGYLWCDPDGEQWSTGNGVVTFRAYTLERMFAQRAFRDANQIKTVSAGAAFAQTIGLLNAVSDTGITVGSIDGTGTPINWPNGHMMANEWVKMLVARSGQEFGIDPVFSGNTLMFKANWYALRGQDRDFWLAEGKNVEWNTMPAMRRQGTIVNHAIVEAFKPNGEARNTGDYLDTASAASYGLAEMLYGTPTMAQSTQGEAAAQVITHSQPRTTIYPTVLDVDNTFDYCGLGDRLPVDFPSLDYEGLTGRWIRILAKSFDDAVGKMELTVDAVN